MGVFDDLIDKIDESEFQNVGNEVLANIKEDTSSEDDDVDDLKDKVMDKTRSTKGKYGDMLTAICGECVAKKRKPYYEFAAEIFEEKGCVVWKDKVKEAERILLLFQDLPEFVRTDNDKWWGDDRPASSCEIGEALQKCLSNMIDAFSRDKILKKLGQPLGKLIIQSLKGTRELDYVVGKGILDSSNLSWDGTGIEKQLPQVFSAVLDWLKREENDITEHGEKSTFAIGVFSSIEEKMIKASTEVQAIFDWIIAEREVDGQPSSGYGTIVVQIMSNILMRGTNNPKSIKGFIPGTVKLMHCGNDMIETMASSAIGAIYQQTELLIPCAEDVIQVYLEGTQVSSLGMVLKPLYAAVPEKVMKYFDQLAEQLEDMNDSNKTFFYMFLEDVAKKEPKRILPFLDIIVGDLQHPSVCHLTYMAVAEVSSEYPLEVNKHRQTLLQVWEKTPMVVSYACKTLANIGRKNEKLANECLEILSSKLKTIDPMYKVVVLMEMKRIGSNYKEALKKYRAAIEAEKNGNQMGLADMVQSIIDFLEDRTLQNLSSEVAETREDIDTLDNRVTNTEKDVERLDEKVDEQEKKIENVENELTEQGERIGVLEDKMEGLMVKVDEIDHKTITNAPKWSRDVAKILNVEDEYDWRFLAIRLGYSGEDVRNWALSPDPTMAVLAEWYATHKSSEATFAILTALQDMGRKDAVKILEEALKEADQMVPSEDDSGPLKPCPVFISYQWDHQPEAKAIKEHLEKAGYSCWMDIGQMGGGDKLFSKISEGMRAAKIVLCMVTERYAMSENCNKEVNLANLLNKPIIPILIENTPWPPPGSMSMLFAQLLYIQFFVEGEYVRGQKFWPDAKFSELLGQINYYAAPDMEAITEEYKNWIPATEEVQEVKIVKAASSSSGQSSSANEQEIADEPPKVFISYQWGKQPEVKKLYSRLTGLGYHCWFDIMQMGGGDPLYAKIDKGIRNAKVVVSCVTSKYALSANCRREVSLSDALRKPIIPLLFEEGTAWPPAGPMAMTFTQLLYIDFTTSGSQQFTNEKFEELLLKLKEHVTPKVVSVDEENTVKPTSTVNNTVDSQSKVIESPNPPAHQANISHRPQAIPSSSEISSQIDETSQKSSRKRNKKSSACCIF